MALFAHHSDSSGKLQYKLTTLRGETNGEISRTGKSCVRNDVAGQFLENSYILYSFKFQFSRRSSLHSILCRVMTYIFYIRLGMSTLCRCQHGTSIIEVEYILEAVLYVLLGSDVKYSRIQESVSPILFRRHIASHCLHELLPLIRTIILLTTWFFA